MRFGLLGPVELWTHGQLTSVGPAKQRAVFALLLLHANRVVSVDQIADALWAEAPPRTARKNVQVYVWRLRRLVGVRLESRAPGYQMSVGPEELDLAEFERLVGRARAARRAGLLVQAAADYRAAVSLWRGASLADVAGIGRLGATAALLDRRRLLAYEDQISVELALGRHAELLPVLDELVTAHPLHERFAEQQILALYRAGRRADACVAYLRCRRVLSRELGVEPGPALQRLARAVREAQPLP
ncbi:MAG TPA: AfsR/SARP family transcriptional regulator [Micromonosporaceae bacterium]|nr:AfsR/SARP family transcriptional regulator [Micromonosporaceae bacterium]